jgi:exosortase/archaeosortase family protein
MLTAFIIVAGFIAYMVKVPRWQKAVVLISSIPVAVICNIVRIFATGMLMLYVGEEFASKFFHDFAGLVMMPIAVSLMFAELWIMDKCVIPDEQPEPEQVVARREAAGRNGRKPARGRPNTSPRRA